MYTNHFTELIFFLVDPYLLNAITDCKYSSIIISDQAPVSIKVTLPTHRTKRTSTSWLCQVNRTGDISSSIPWQTLKANLRGQIISRSSHKSKTNNKKINDLSSERKTRDGLISISPTIQTEIDLLTSSNAEKLILNSRSRFFSNLPNFWLFNFVRKQHLLIFHK